MTLLRQDGEVQPREFSPWNEPTVVDINRLPMRQHLGASATVEAARRGRFVRRISLDGRWKFRLFKSPDEVDDTFFRGASAKLGSAWHHIEVPANWTMQDVGDHPHYTNITMPFDGPPPRLPEYNPTGVYRRSFTVPRTWQGTQIVLHLGAADSVHLVYVNKQFVGYGTDNRLASEYDISRYVRVGSNELAVVVVRYSAQSYVEDQDQWWMAGLHRSVFVEARSMVHVRTISCLVDYDAATRIGSADLNIEVAFAGTPAPGVRVQTWIEDLAGHRVCEPQMLSIPHKYDERYVFRGHRVTTRLAVRDARPWSAEDPHRYRVMVKLLGPTREYTAMLTGFRRIRVEHGEIRVNDQRITVRGVNRHDHHPERGKAVTRADMVADVVAMKQLNCNAVRTSHYPNDPAFLDVCDEYGLYVVAEANIEAHAYNTSLCDDPSYLATWLARGARMVVRDRHHPSVIFWSLGNESGFGVNHDALAALVRSLDPTRPLHYEGAIFHGRNGETHAWRNGGRNATDVVCPMYPPISAIVDYAQSGAERPLVMCEYSHAMGNSNGSLADYWVAIEREPLLAGGFIWEWKDHGLRQRVDPKANPTRSTWRYAYGGQFGDHPNDGNFVADGITATDLTPHPATRELAWVHRPVAVSAAVTSATMSAPDSPRTSISAFVVHNRRAHTSLNDLLGVAVLLVDGESKHEEAIETSLAPHQRETCEFSAQLQAAIAAAPQHATMMMQFRWTQRFDTAFASAGHLVAWDEIVLCDPVIKRSAPALRGGVDTISDHHAADTVFTAPIRLALMRAPIDNDGYKLMPGFGEANRIGGRALARWQRQGILADTIPAGIQHVQQRQVHDDGSVTYQHRVVVPDSLAHLPRIGVRFALPSEFAHVRWFGRGPHENYPDRNSGAMRDVWAREPDELPYLVPQEFGLRTDCEWIELVAPHSRVRIDALSPATLHFSAVHHTPLQLFRARDTTDLLRATDLVVHLDVAHRGVGTASCGPDVLPDYEIPAGTYEFSYVVRRI